MIVPGSKLEKYEVLEKVGEGGMATVYRGRHTTLNREVAIKVMHPHLSSSEKNRTRFAREARAIETLRHPNILRIFDYSGGAADHCFIITEFIEGPTLRELLEEVGAMMPEPAALVTYELCKALEVAHAQGIVHRDVKPENVMLTPDGGIKLMDFGIARMLDDAQVTMTGALVGSPAYMSPEQATDGDVGQASDLFAVGIMLYRMVTGTLPFRGSNPSIVIKAIIDGIYEDPTNRVPSLSADLADVIRRCLNRDLDVRYSTATEVRKDLQACLAAVGIDADAPGGWDVRSYLDDFESYEEALRAHLLETLVTRGRAEAEGGRSAEALRTFNRVLALDEDNVEVVQIIEGMRLRTADEGQRTSGMLWVAAALVLASTALGLSWQLGMFATTEVASLAPAVLIPSIPVPIPDQEVAPPEPTPEPTPEALAPIPEAVALTRAEQGRRLGANVPEATPPEVALVTEEETGTAGPPEEPEICEGSGSVVVRVEDNWTHVRVDGDLLVTPDGADLIVDTRTSKTLSLPAGSYEIALLNRYRLPQIETVRVCGGREPTVLVASRPFKPHRVVFEGFPGDAEVHVDDQLRGRAGAPLALPARTQGYSVRVVQGGKNLASKVLTVNETDELPGETTVLRPDS